MRAFLLVLIGTFAPAVAAQNPRASQQLDNGGLSFDPVLDSEGDLTAIAWSENQNIMVATSDGTGLSWTAGVVHGTIVTAAWTERPAGSLNEVMTVNTSTDGGSVFGGPQMVGGYTPPGHDVDSPRVTIAGNGNIVAIWEDDRAGRDEIYAATSLDGGSTWVESRLSNGAGLFGGFPRISASRATADPDVTVVWTGEGGTFPPDAVRAAMSTDGGVTWQPALDASDTVGDADFGEVIHNARYNNFSIAWLSDDLGMNNLYVGGFRPQSVTANGWGSCPRIPILSFDLSGFGSGDLVAFVALSTGAGPVTLPRTGGLTIGLLPDPLFFATLLDPVAFNTALAGGTGTTPVLPNPFGCPTGIDIFYAAIAFGVSGPTVITDTGSFQL